MLKELLIYKNIKMTEEYRDIPDFPNYEVSNLGNVRNKKTNKILKPREFKKRSNYICYGVQLYNDTRQLGYHKKIHKLVAEAFIPNPENKPEIDHIDRNSSNNKVDNLRWATRSENCINTKTRCDNDLGERNICFNNDIQRYQVEIVRNKKKVFYGSYIKLEDAIKARDDFLNGITENPHKPRQNKTGEKYITKRSETSYRFEIERNKIRHFKTFPSLEEAIKARDDFLTA